MSQGQARYDEWSTAPIIHYKRSSAPLYKSMRADARKNYEHLLAVAREVVAEQGADASLRDIARKAEVGLGTLYRRFPTREALLETLLRETFDNLSARAKELMLAKDTGAALILWVREAVSYAQNYRGVIATMVAAIEDPESALHDSCVVMRAAGAELLSRAQSEGKARIDMEGFDLFALISALAWLRDQPSFLPRADYLFSLITSSIFTNVASSR